MKLAFKCCIFCMNLLDWTPFLFLSSTHVSSVKLLTMLAVSNVCGFGCHLCSHTNILKWSNWDWFRRRLNLFNFEVCFCFCFSVPHALESFDKIFTEKCDKLTTTWNKTKQGLRTPTWCILPKMANIYLFFFPFWLCCSTIWFQVSLFLICWIITSMWHTRQRKCSIQHIHSYSEGQQNESHFSSAGSQDLSSDCWCEI